MGAFKYSWMYVILSKLGQYVKEMRAVTANSFWSSFLIIRKHVSKASDVILRCDLTSDGVTENPTIYIL